MARKVAMTDGKANLAIDAENVSYMESMGWQRIVQEEFDEPEPVSKTVIGIPELQVYHADASPEPSEAPSPASDAPAGTDAAQALAQAVEAAKTPTKRR